VRQGLGQVRGMKVRSSVKKMCEGCKVCGVVSLMQCGEKMGTQMGRRFDIYTRAEPNGARLHKMELGEEESGGDFHEIFTDSNILAER
jgi:MinD superfamily P-loop ATPase